jgi:hypothetical protein
VDNKNKKIICDICGADTVAIMKRPTSLPIPFGEDARFNKLISHCTNCGEEIDVSNDDDRIKAIAAAEKATLEAIIGYIVSQGYTLANIERALDLPQRTISRWKSGQEPSAAGLTLLRFIRIFPWLIQVAEKNYDVSYSKSILMHEAIYEFDSLRQCIDDDPQKKLGIVQITKADKSNSVIIMAGANFSTETSPAVETQFQEVA